MSPEEQKKKNEEKYSAIRKVITLMIHCIDCDDEECALMPYCLDYQDLLVHMEECTEKKCRMKVTLGWIPRHFKLKLWVKRENHKNDN